MIGLVAASLLAAAGCTPGGEFEPRLCPAGLPKVVAVTIEEQGASLWRDTDPGPPCSAFRLSIADVQRFFSHAGRADPREVHFTLPESPCVARGTVRFADGSRGRWQIDRFALGWLDRSDQTRMTLYCRRCHKKPWQQ